MNQLRDSRILITGGAGFVGSHTAELLIKTEDVKEVIIVDNFLRGHHRNLEAALPSGKLTIVKGDIRDEALLGRLMDGIDYCFHMAALRITRCAENPREALEVMHTGTFNVADACAKAKVKKVVAASSASVLGQADMFPTSERHHPYNNRTFYGAAKAANELMLRSFQDMYGLAFTALRYFNIYGPRMDAEGKYTEVLIRWYYMILEGKEPLIYGDGSQTMDFVYVGDVARANVLAMKANGNNDVLNIASGTETSLVQLCLALLSVMDSRLQPKFVPLPVERQKVEVMRRLADTTMAQEQIGFSALTSLEAGLRELVAWVDLLQGRVT